MHLTALPHVLSFFALTALIALPAAAAQGDDPDWPCIQRKVPELSLGQVWNGPELPKLAADWARDPVVASLVQEIAARRVPVPQAQEKIRAFGQRLSAGDRNSHLSMLVQGLFDHMNAERSDVIAGIARYAHRQRDMAALLRREAAAVDALRANSDMDQADVAQRNERLIFQTRVFQERAQSLAFVCEVPTLIEQRLYALAKTIDAMLEQK